MDGIFLQLTGRFENPGQMMEWIFVASAVSLLAIWIPSHPMKFLLTGLAEWLNGWLGLLHLGRKLGK